MGDDFEIYETVFSENKLHAIPVFLFSDDMEC